MARYHTPISEDQDQGPPPVPAFGGRPPKFPAALWQHFRGGGWGKRLIILAIAYAIVYALYFWEIRRVVVPQGHVLVLMKKDGGRSLPTDNFVIPRLSADASESERADWEKLYGDANGILEEVQQPGTYFRYSPFDYDREVIDISQTGAIVPNGKVGIVIRKFGKPLDPMVITDRLEPGQVLADASRGQRGPLPMALQPGQYTEYANPYAYEIKLVDPVQIDPAHRGVVTLMSGRSPKTANEYLVAEGERGVQRATEPEGFRYVNPFERRVMPISIQSHRYEMTGEDVIRFPSSDSFDIQLDGFVEWSIIPDKLPLIYVEYGEGGTLIEFLEEKVILPYARSLCRTVGSQYNARDFISGDTKLKFQAEFEKQLAALCHKQGIEVLQALVRDIVPPGEIKEPINEREIAKQQIKSIEQQIQVARSKADLAMQEQMGDQNKQIGESNKTVVIIVKKAEQERDVTLTQANQRLAVAKLRLQAAQKEADAQIARGQADAAVILMGKEAEAEPLRRQVEAFGDGNAYAQYYFFQKVAPAIKSILSDTEGTFGQLFRQFLAAPPATAAKSLSPRTEVTP